jgi:hypothetical protein
MWGKRLIVRRRPRPIKLKVTETTDLEDLLRKLQSTIAQECADWSRWARDWGSWSVILAVLSALGSGAAGATVASISSLSNWERALVVLLAFAGAALSGIAAAVGAPSQAKAASEKADQLASLERWACLVIVELPEITDEAVKLERCRALISWRDQIFGITAPESLDPTKRTMAPVHLPT